MYTLCRSIHGSTLTSFIFAGLSSFRHYHSLGKKTLINLSGSEVFENGYFKDSPPTPPQTHPDVIMDGLKNFTRPVRPLSVASGSGKSAILSGGEQGQ